MRHTVKSAVNTQPEKVDYGFKDGDIAIFYDGPDGNKKHVAIRRDYRWKEGEWQVAIHGFWRVTDKFIHENGWLLVEVESND